MARKPVTKAVIAAAGFGTRFLPQTKAIPKEMLPLIDKPVIQYIVEELVDAGINDIIIVTGYSKRAIEDHFDKPSEDLLNNLRQGGPSKAGLLKEVMAIADLANFIYLRQKGPYGPATPVLNAEHLLDDSPFIFTYSDDFFVATPSRFKQMIEAYNTYNCPILSTLRVTDDKDYSRYGFVSGRELSPNHIEIQEIIEKPGKAKAPSDLATVSGYLLTPDIFKYFHKNLANLKPGREFFATDALNMMVKSGERVVALEIANGRFYDIGNKISYLKTLIEFGLNMPEVRDELKEYLTNVLSEV